MFWLTNSSTVTFPNACAVEGGPGSQGEPSRRTPDLKVSVLALPVLLFELTIARQRF